MKKDLITTTTMPIVRQNPYNDPVRTTREMLRGRPVISYLRFSAVNQGKGSTLERQHKVLLETLAEFGMVLDQQFIDRGTSASKGVHRKKASCACLWRCSV